LPSRSVTLLFSPSNCLLMQLLWKPGQVPVPKKRPSTAHLWSTYSLVNYVAYVLYPPLYLAGPIITFNDFMWQVRTYCSGAGVAVLKPASYRCIIP
jgi:D-alanyl-lipoteichoic acid acyltransferase DltB (MBOAT superfamily)